MPPGRRTERQIDNQAIAEGTEYGPKAGDKFGVDVHTFQV